ncbi:hypothetical protein GCM10007164_28070 [Luteimonas padinae]|uniref:S1 family peptidase n=1 Tax=Luteimonas padinae TaxID=1714359 RepID=A0ABV6SVZ4_9GAMM|nr:hypothetical protein [Luteimonas padinae]GHD75727.1 hypothetical protein GCM10007164_28070 [Luteimonas padinae]
MKRKIFVASILALASAGMSVTAFGQDADPVLEAYAAAYDLTYEEARDRLILMDSGTLAELHDQLKRDPSFAGMRIVHKPTLKLIIYAKGNAVRLATKASVSIPVEAVDVPRSLSELQAAAGSVTRSLQAAGARFEIDIEPGTGTIIVYTEDDAAAKNVLGEDTSRKLPFLKLVKSAKRAEPTATFIGGQRVSGSRECTSGFTVYRTSNPSQRGVVTAGHCGTTSVRVNNVLFNQPVSRMYSGDYDQMWFTASGHTWTNTIYTGQSIPATISIQATYDPIVGALLCKYGRASGQTCGEITSTNAGVTNPDNGTVGYYYRVRNLTPNQPMTINGDSGGPVFGTSGVAFGIVHGRGSGQFVNDMYFMPAHRFSAIGASVLTTP